MRNQRMWTIMAPLTMVFVIIGILILGGCAAPVIDTPNSLVYRSITTPDGRLVECIVYVEVSAQCNWNAGILGEGIEG